MSTVPAEVQGPSDAELIDAVRKGTVSAYGSLYERHVASAYNLARQLTRSQAEADDLVSEAFAKVLDTLRAGRGPDSAFRAYLLTALRHTAYDKTRRDRKIELSEDVETASGVSAAAVSVPFSDTAVAGLERSLAARAFARLPERWQAVLWHTEIEGQSPAEVAPILGLTPNGVSALAYRAREGLRQAYLQVHLTDTTEQRCRTTTDRLGAWTRDGLSKREKAQVEAHLDDCDRCRALAAELADVNGALRAFVAPLVLGPASLAYLAAAGAAKGTATTVGIVLGATGAAAAGTAGTTSSSGGAAAGAASSLPRQITGVAASAAALAAAVAIGLAAGGDGQRIPQAQATEQPPVVPVAPPNQPPPPPPNNPPQAPPPNAPQQPTPPPARSPQPPTPPNLTANPPGVPVALIAGGGPADLPITVRNTGGSVSGPVSATLALPAGVSAIASDPSGLSGTPLLRLNGARAGTVFCPGGTGSVTCRSEAGLQPDESVTLLFRLVAAEGSAGGEITGSVSDGTTVNVRVAVRVVVRPPALTDGVDLAAYGGWFDTLLPGLLPKPLVHVTVTNTGTSTKPISVTVDQAGVLLVTSRSMDCASGGDATTCTTRSAIPPGGVVKLTIKLRGWLGLLCRDESVMISAMLGTAKDAVTIGLHCWSWPSLPGLLPNSTSQDVTPQAPPKPPTKPSIDTPQKPGKPSDPPAAVTPQPPPSPTPTPVLPPALPPAPSERSTPPPDKPGLLSILTWLLPG